MIFQSVPLDIFHINNNRICNFYIIELSQKISKFWELESSWPAFLKSKSDLICENHFKTTIRRNSSGRFIVSMPFVKPLITRWISESDIKHTHCLCPEIWTSHTTPESKRQSMEWHHSRSPTKLKKAKPILSTRKVMTTVYVVNKFQFSYHNKCHSNTKTFFTFKMTLVYGIGSHDESWRRYELKGGLLYLSSPCFKWE